MSGRNGNPYANPYANTYGSGNYAPAASPGSNPYQNPYGQQNDSSTGSVNTYGGPGRRPGGYGGFGEPPARSPGPPSASLRGGSQNRYDNSEENIPVPALSPGRPRNRFASVDNEVPPPLSPRNRFASVDTEAPPFPGPINNARNRYGSMGNDSRPALPSPDSGRNRYMNGDGANQEQEYSRPTRAYEESSRSRDRGMRNGTNGFGGAGAGGQYGGRQYNSRREPRGMEDVLKYIQSEWSFMGSDDCIPVQVALQLMDTSSLGLANKEGDFQQTQEDLQKALKTIVNEHHQDFNSSIGTYHKIQDSLQSSQSRVRYLKNALVESKGGLLTTKPELKGLATSSQAYDDMLQIFIQIENLQAVPEKLEARISEKRFLTAVDVLQDALRSVRRSELDDIGGISDLRSYFSNQEVSLTDILVEELHDHLYLKSPYCQNRWKRHKNEESPSESPDYTVSDNANSWDRPVYRYLSALDTSTPLADDASRNVESDTFYYIHMLLESLNKLGHLDTAVSRIEQRLPVELFGVVEKTNSEVDARYPSIIRGDTKKGRAKISLPSDSTDSRSTVLSDFLWTLYSKFEAIAEGHRVLHEVITGIVSREKLPKPDTYAHGFKELWKLYQSEMRSLLHDYLATDGDMTLRTGMTSVENNNIFGRNQRDKSKRMFRLGEMDSKSAAMREEQEDLDEILKTSVPGLVSKSRNKAGQANTAGRSGQESSSAGHKLLIEPSVFNMTLLLPPSLSFLQKLKDIVPTNSDIAMSTLTSFLDDFLINVFHPQLEETITELCTQCMIDLEAFTEDSQWAIHSPRPIFKVSRGRCVCQTFANPP